MWHVKFESKDDDVVRTNDVMMRAADDKMRSDNGMTIADEDLKTTGPYLPQFIWEINQKFITVKLESFWILLRIAWLASGKSYLVMNFCISHEVDHRNNHRKNRDMET